MKNSVFLSFLENGKGLIGYLQKAIEQRTFQSVFLLTSYMSKRGLQTLSEQELKVVEEACLEQFSRLCDYGLGEASTIHVVVNLLEPISDDEHILEIKQLGSVDAIKDHAAKVP